MGIDTKVDAQIMVLTKEKEKLAWGYDGKPLEWKERFDAIWSEAYRIGEVERDRVIRNFINFKAEDNG